MARFAKPLLLTIVVLAVLVGGRPAGQSGAQQRLTPAEIKWPAGSSLRRSAQRSDEEALKCHA